MLSFSTYFISAEPPKFIKKPEALQFVRQGDTVQLECKITGTPEIKITWYKNDQALQASNRLHMSFVESTAVLTILDASAEDAGDYICEAQNSAGAASCSTSVSVKGQQHVSTHHQNPDPTPSCMARQGAATVVVLAAGAVSPAAFTFEQRCDIGNRK